MHRSRPKSGPLAQAGNWAVGIFIVKMIARRLDITSPLECNATAACPTIFKLDDYLLAGTSSFTASLLSI
jgi:hypothetical protein